MLRLTTGVHMDTSKSEEVSNFWVPLQKKGWGVNPAVPVNSYFNNPFTHKAYPEHWFWE